MLNTLTSGFSLTWLNICTSPFAALCFSLQTGYDTPNLTLIFYFIFFKMQHICNRFPVKLVSVSENMSLAASEKAFIINFFRFLAND